MSSKNLPHMIGIFGEYIRKLRKESGMTLSTLAASLDIDQSTLSKIENGRRNVPLFILPKLAITFSLDLNELKSKYSSDKIVEIVFHFEEPKSILKLAEKKIKDLKLKTKDKNGKY